MATYFPRYYFYDAVGMSESKVKPVYQERTIDFSVQNVTTSDAVSMLAVPDNTLVMMCNYQTLSTVTSGSATFVIASETAAISYVASAVAVAAGSFGVPATISANTAQKWYEAKDDIRIKTVAAANMTAGAIKVFALMLFPQPYRYLNPAGTAFVYTVVDKNAWTTTTPAF